MTFNNKYSAGIFTALLTSLLFSAQVSAQALTATRSSSFTYNAQGLLLTETIEPTAPQSCLVTTHGYDGYGNKAIISAVKLSLELTKLISR